MKKSNVKKMIQASAMAAADAWFCSHGPAGHKLPRGYAERERIKGDDPLSFIVSVFDRSLEANDYRFRTHPRFDDYASGVLASPLVPSFVKEDPQLLAKYPPAELPGLGAGLMWKSV